MVTYTSEDSDGENEAINVMRDALSRYRKGVAQPAGETLIVDQANGYIRYERKDGDHLQVNEMCYWNEADKKHKLFDAWLQSDDSITVANCILVLCNRTTHKKNGTQRHQLRQGVTELLRLSPVQRHEKSGIAAEYIEKV